MNRGAEAGAGAGLASLFVLQSPHCFGFRKLPGGCVQTGPTSRHEEAKLFLLYMFDIKNVACVM